MNAEEIVRALRWLAKETEFTFAAENLNGAADLIESLQAQLADYHHMSELVDGKMAENQRLRRINENLQEQLNDVVPVVRGEWVKKSSEETEILALCSKCSYPISWWHKTNYCPSCGAKMESEGGT